ncbi:polysaccharide pyruvyl transferase family protein [Flexibacterium corallicola]|uniref:polysaccharide pyruvyl transferase family protein n=1 Tax=Flexibacterium corallicola TaxID=3037259 RepID=UPI00286F9FDD|nr:polysaccharide pyruvyl transferase family protein [Pseudovibrio sp. M1P-2-3]
MGHISNLSRERDIKPNIGISGSLGRGNYGDELYLKNYQYWFGSWARVFLLTGLPRPYYMRHFSENLVDMMDAVVVGGGDLICPYRPKVDQDFVNKLFLRRSVHIAGVGVEQNRSDIHPDVLSKWKQFLCNANIKSISTRDPLSQAWIEKNVKPAVGVRAHSDLACALPLPKVGRIPKEPIVGLVTRHIKHPKEYLLMAEIAKRLAAKGWKVHHIIAGVGKHGEKDFENAKALKVPGKKTKYTQSLDEISRSIGQCSLVLSMKLHATIVAMMYDVPTISLNPVVKARAFMESVGRESLVFKCDDRQVLECVEAGVPRVPTALMQQKTAEASSYMRQLCQNIWSDFLVANPELNGHVKCELSLP